MRLHGVCGVTTRVAPRFGSCVSSSSYVLQRWHRSLELSHRSGGRSRYHHQWSAKPGPGFSVVSLRNCFSRASTGNVITSASRSKGMASFMDNAAARYEDGLSDFALDGTKITSVAHSVWQQVVKAGDTVIDATCGNGHDTLILARLVSGESQQGYVYGIDLQQSALDSTSSLLERELNPFQREHVKLLQMCHSKLEEVVKPGDHVSLVAFNLGYLPGGDKKFITCTDITVEALKSATRVLKPGGIISVIAYIGHPGGREEYEAVRHFASDLPTTCWVCSHHEWLNRPLSPRLLFLCRK